MAEDDDSLRTMLELALRREGFDVIACTDGMRAREALASVAAGERRLHAALLDLRMPGVSGTELIGDIRANAALRQLPVIAMSGHSDALQAQEARGVGADAFLAKPFSIDQLGALLRSVLGGTTAS